MLTLLPITLGVKEEFESTGFVDVETHVLDASIGYESHDQFAEMLLQMPVVKNTTDEYSEDERNKLQGYVVEQLKNVNSAEPGELQGTTIVALARKAVSS